ncbi:hypothetical protein [Acidovorax sp. Q11]
MAFHKEIMLAAAVSLVITAERGGAVHVGVKAGPFMRSYSITMKKLDDIVEALLNARIEARP